MKARLCLVPLHVCILSLAFGQAQNPAEQKEIERRILDACRSDKISHLDSLVKASRLSIKPLLDDVLTQAIRSEAEGKNDGFRDGLEKARLLSLSFQRVHSEKSLVLAVDNVRRWSKSERRMKIVADSLHALGTKLRGKAETRDSALAVYLKALSLYRSIEDRRGEGTALGSIGFIYWYKNEPQKALQYFEEGLKVRSLVDDQQLVGNSYNDIGSVYYNFLKEYPKAIEYHRQSERVRQQIGDKSGLGRTLDNLALDYWDMGDRAEAQRLCEAAARAHTDAGDQERVGRSIYNSGLLLTDLGKYSDAFLAFDRALDIRQKLGDQGKIADVFDARGVLYSRVGDDESAYGDYQQALALKLKAEDERGVAAASYKIGTVLENLGRTDQALQAYQKSLDVFQKIGDREGILQTLSNMGVARFALKQYPKSEELTREALGMSRELQDSLVEINNLIMLGNAQNFQGKPDSARGNYILALNLAERRTNLDLMWGALLGLGDLEEKRHADEAAIGFYMRAFDCIEGQRGSLGSEQFKISFASGRRFVYEAIVHLMTTLHERHPSAGYDDRAFRVAEAAKARAFLDLLVESRANVREGADSLLMARQDSLLASINSARAQVESVPQGAPNSGEAIAGLRMRIDDFERQLRSVRSELRARNPRYALLRHADPIGIEDVRTGLVDPQTVFLEYSVGDSSSSLWAITQQERHLYRLPDREALKAQVEILRSVLSEGGGKDVQRFRTVARRLYRLLVGPAETSIRDGSRLLIVPDGELNYVPFEVLLTDDGGGSYGDLPYLLKRHPIVYVQSAAVMHTLREQRKSAPIAPRKGLIAFGDPVFTDSAYSESSPMHAVQPPGLAAVREGLPRLPFTGSEVSGIAKLFPHDAADVYVQAGASEDRVKQKGLLMNYRFIHFATHGLINERKPDLSAIVLSTRAGSPEDGILYSSEIFNLRTAPELVVLSACQTGLGKISRGEGLIGLTRAFMYAGSPSVVVSLWNVADISTSTLMQNFYQGMVTRNEDKSEALRRAKISMCLNEKYSHPFYWAPFVLIGDWKFEP
jgi:CHAT domain-containing protein/tetratricopeptide (TPR) repeat protein